MAKAIALLRSQTDRSADILRAAIVLACAAALVAAGQATPFSSF